MEQIIKIMWAVKIGDPDWKEVVITENAGNLGAAKLWCEQNGYNRIRISEIDMNVKPDFVNSINKTPVTEKAKYRYF